MSPAMPPAMRCYSAVGEGARAGRCAGTLRRAYPTREFLLGPSVLGHRLDSDYLQTLSVAIFVTSAAALVDCRHYGGGLPTYCMFSIQCNHSTLLVGPQNGLRPQLSTSIWVGRPNSRLHL
eukprot:8068124-Pyramimonas_sp.AAC.1